MGWNHFSRSCRHRQYAPNTSFDAPFYIKNVLPIVKREGNRLIGPDFTFQRDSSKPHTSETTIDTIESMRFSLIGPDIWPPNSPDLNPLVEVHLKTKTFKMSLK